MHFNLLLNPHRTSKNDNNHNIFLYVNKNLLNRLTPKYYINAIYYINLIFFHIFLTYKILDDNNEKKTNISTYQQH